MMKWIKITAIASLGIAALGISLSDATEQRIPIDAKINDKPVHLAFDTGADKSLLLRDVAKRLGLKILKRELKEPIPAGKIAADLAEECNVTFGGISAKARFGVIDAPSHVRSDVDGFISWNWFTNHVVLIDFEWKSITVTDDPPERVNKWNKWKLVPNCDVLVFECTNGVEIARVGIDTGASSGVRLSRKRWEKWRGERANQRATIEAFSDAVGRLEVKETLRARKFTIGGIVLEDVPVSVATPSEEIAFEHADAIFGCFILQRLKMVIDGKHGVLYTDAILFPDSEYAYNRLGSVFVPKDVQKTDELVAHVCKSSPADRAGIRNGDILLKVGELDVTKWRTDPHVSPLSRFWEQAAGTKLMLTLKRGDQQYQVAVTLTDLLAE